MNMKLIAASLVLNGLLWVQGSRVQDLEDALQQCNHGLARSVELTDCASGLEYNGEFEYNVTGIKGKYPESGLCVIDFNQHAPNDSAYSMSVELYIDDDQNGMLGVYYNAADAHNFETVWFSITSTACNYRTASYVDGAIVFNKLAATRGCPNRNVFPRQWFTVSVQVVPDKAKAEMRLDGVGPLHDEDMVFPRRAVGGVIINNRFGTRILFRNFRIE